MSISRNGICVNIPNAPRFTILPRSEYASYIVSDPTERSLYCVYLGSMSRCDCPTWGRAGKCAHVDAAKAFRDAELYGLANQKPRRTPKRLRMSGLSVKRRPSIRVSMEALEWRTRREAEANALRAEAAREWDALLGSDGGSAE
jgi:hypothetical protein